MKEILRKYLDSSPEDSRILREELERSSHSSVLAIFSERGDGSPDFFPDKLQPLLNHLVQTNPQMLLECDLNSFSSGQRWALYVSGIAASEPKLRDFVLKGLDDRSLDIRLLVVEAIPSSPSLQTLEAKKKLKRILALKSFKPYEARVRRAIEAISEC